MHCGVDKVRVAAGVEGVQLKRQCRATAWRQQTPQSHLAAAASQPASHPPTRACGGGSLLAPGSKGIKLGA
jgi:hypothetical protein